MPKNFSKYQYETSPRKIKPDYTPPKNPYKQKKTTTATKNQEKKKQKTKTKFNKSKVIVYVLLGFAILFVISYRNAQIDENFSQVQELKQELATLKKENEQIEVSIESGLNLSNLEKQAEELLGMKKLTNKQTIYVNLPKSDYIEASSEDVIIDNSTSTWQDIINVVTNLFK